MSNLGLEHALAAEGIEFLRAKVGDRYVLAMLKEHGGVLGGETSGHLLCLDRTTTGDGLISALQVLAAMKRTGLPLAELAAGMPKFPQVMVNVRVRERSTRRSRPRSRPRGAGRGGARRHGPRRAARVGHRARDPRHGRRARGRARPAVADELAEAVREAV